MTRVWMVTQAESWLLRQTPMERILVSRTMNRWGSALCIGLGWLSACASQSRPKSMATDAQSFAQAIALICTVDALASVRGDTAELERSRAREDYIVENVKNPDAIYFVTIWRTKPPEYQAAMLAEQALKSRITDCPLSRALLEP